MKKYARLLALILALAMCFSLLAGCGSSSDDEEEEEEETEAEEEETEEEDPFANGVQYPLVDDDEIVYLEVFMPLAGFMPLVLEDGDLNSSRGVQLAAEATGVYFDWMAVDQDAYSEQFNILFVSGDLPDIIAAPEAYYSGGIDAVIDDGYCIDLMQYKDTYLKDFFDFVEEAGNMDEYLKNQTSDSGQMCTIWSFVDSTTAGLVIRQDWLDAVGMDVPETYDELYEVLKAWQTELGIESPMYITQGWSFSQSLFVGGYTTQIGSQINGDLDWVVNEDGEAVACCISDDFKEFLQLLNAWWEEGLISEDSLSIANIQEINDYVSQGKVGFWAGQTDALTLEVDDDYEAVPIANIVKESGDTVKTGNYSGQVGNSGWAVSADCEYPEIAAGVINWFWTDEGYIVANFGQEGVTFNYGDDDEIIFTDLILNNENGYSSLFNSCSEILFFDFPFYYSLTRKAATFSTDVELESQTVWGSNETNELRYYGDLNTEESEVYSALVGDISTYVSETISKFITGEKSFDDWDEYVAQIEELGIDQLVEVQTAAYQRYLAR